MEREKEKSTGIQLGIEPGTFRLLDECSYYCLHITAMLGALANSTVLASHTVFWLNYLPWVQWLSGTNVCLVIRRSQVRFPAGSLWIYLSLSLRWLALHTCEHERYKSNWTMIVRKTSVIPHHAQKQSSYSRTINKSHLPKKMCSECEKSILGSSW